MNTGFSNRMKDVFTYVREEVLRLGDDSIGAEHLFLGILREGGCTAINILKGLMVFSMTIQILNNIHYLVLLFNYQTIFLDYLYS